MILTLCLLAIIIAIFAGWKLKINTGVISLAFAFYLGYFGLGLKVNEIIAFWPTTIVFYLISISLFFSYATLNGTMDLFGKKLLYMLGGNAKLIPIAIILVCAIVGGLGAGASTPVIVGPFIFVIALGAGISPALTAICIGYGNLIGSSNPFNGYGGVIGKNLLIDNGLDEAQAMKIAMYTWANTVIITLVILAIFYVYYKGFKAERVKVEAPEAFSKVQRITFIVVLLAFVAMIVPSLLNTWISNPLLKKVAGICQPQVIMVTGAVICALLKLEDEKKVIKAIPINTIVMIVGVYTLIKVAGAAGLIEKAAEILSGSIPAFLVPCAIVMFAAFLSFFSSSTSTVMPLMYPMIPALVAGLGLNAVTLYSCIFFGGLTTAMSPFSTGGALTIASCPDNRIKEELSNKMILVSLVIPVITAAAATLGVMSLFSV